MKINVFLCSVLFVIVNRSICLIQGGHSGDDPVGGSSVGQWHRRWIGEVWARYCCYVHKFTNKMIKGSSVFLFNVL